MHFATCAPERLQEYERQVINDASHSSGDTETAYQRGLALMQEITSTGVLSE